MRLSSRYRQRFGILELYLLGRVDCRVVRVRARAGHYYLICAWLKVRECHYVVALDGRSSAGLTALRYHILKFRHVARARYGYLYLSVVARLARWVGRLLLHIQARSEGDVAGRCVGVRIGVGHCDSVLTSRNVQDSHFFLIYRGHRFSARRACGVVHHHYGVLSLHRGRAFTNRIRNTARDLQRYLARVVGLIHRELSHFHAYGLGLRHRYRLVPRTVVSIGYHYGVVACRNVRKGNVLSLSSGLLCYYIRRARGAHFQHYVVRSQTTRWTHRYTSRGCILCTARHVALRRDSRQLIAVEVDVFRVLAREAAVVGRHGHFIPAARSVEFAIVLSVCSRSSRGQGSKCQRRRISICIAICVFPCISVAILRVARRCLYFEASVGTSVALYHLVRHGLNAYRRGQEYRVRRQACSVPLARHGQDDVATIRQHRGRHVVSVERECRWYTVALREAEAVVVHLARIREVRHLDRPTTIVAVVAHLKVEVYRLDARHRCRPNELARARYYSQLVLYVFRSHSVGLQLSVEHHALQVVLSGLTRAAVHGHGLVVAIRTSPGEGRILYLCLREAVECHKCLGRYAVASACLCHLHELVERHGLRILERHFFRYHAVLAVVIRTKVCRAPWVGHFYLILSRIEVAYYALRLACQFTPIAALVAPFVPLEARRAHCVLGRHFYGAFASRLTRGLRCRERCIELRQHYRLEYQRTSVRVRRIIRHRVVVEDFYHVRPCRQAVERYRRSIFIFLISYRTRLYRILRAVLVRIPLIPYLIRSLSASDYGHFYLASAFCA